jgi:putative SOS response-associated peptidase YedK
LWEG